MKLKKKEVDLVTKDFRARLIQSAKTGKPHESVFVLGKARDERVAVFLVFAGHTNDAGYKCIQSCASKLGVDVIVHGGSEKCQDQSTER